MEVVGDLNMLRGITPVVHIGSTTMLYRANITMAVMIPNAKVPRNTVIHFVSPLVVRVSAWHHRDQVDNTLLELLPPKRPSQETIH